MPVDWGGVMVGIPEIDENVQIYEEVVRNLCVLYKELGIDSDPVNVWETFIFMYKNGFLSDCKKFLNTIPKVYVDFEYEYNWMDVEGIMLLAGCGVCRNIADFLTHIYQNLGYFSSQLFTYSPELKMRVICEKLMINSEIQKYIDEVLIDLDLFAKERFHLKKNFGNVIVYVDYFPSDALFLLNHTINIVLDRDNLVHIIDAQANSVGEKIDDNTVKLNNVVCWGYSQKNFIQDNVKFNTYYDNDFQYYRGISLFNEDKADVMRDTLESIRLGANAGKNICRYEEFYLENKKYYSEVTKNINRLVKKL